MVSVVECTTAKGTEVLFAICLLEVHTGEPVAFSTLAISLREVSVSILGNQILAALIALGSPGVVLEGVVKLPLAVC